ncbi:MAG: hypothetical protein N3F07_00165 [Candidatus Micrarchaeota archaeon]|nr:hypothetical protein [Candidatus Micrarchaeota archaeon]
MADRMHFVSKAAHLDRDFKQITMPMMRKRLLEHKNEVKAGVASFEVPLTKRQIARGLTYLEECNVFMGLLVERAKEAPEDSLPTLIKTMESTIKEVESLSPPSLVEKSDFASLGSLLSLYKLPKKAEQIAESFGKAAFNSRLVLLKEENNSGIYLHGKPNACVGSLSILSTNIPEGHLFSPSTKLVYPVVEVDYDFASKSFKVQSMVMKISANGSKFQLPLLKTLNDMVEEMGVSFIFFLDSLTAAAENIGLAPKKVEDALHTPSAYSFECRTPSLKDPDPARNNNFRHFVFEASIEISSQRAQHFSSVVGSAVLPDGALSITIYYGSHERSERFVYSREHKAFIYKR